MLFDAQANGVELGNQSGGIGGTAQRIGVAGKLVQVIADAVQGCEFTASQLDHYLTKKKYPEYAWLSCNLVPACSCNRLRGEKLFDLNTKARVLHPYYDECLGRPLIDLRFDPGVKPPVFEIHYMIDEADPDYENVKFHVDNIIRKTNFLIHISKRWEKLKARPDTILPKHKDYRDNKDQFHMYLTELSEGKSVDEGANSWGTIFLRSISNRIVSDWIFDNFKNFGCKL